MLTDFTPSDLTSILKDWGVTLSTLALVAGALSLLLILGAREFLLWFLQINKVIKTQNEILKRMRSLEASLDQKPATEVFTQSSGDAAAASQFPISAVNDTPENQNFKLHS